VTSIGFRECDAALDLFELITGLRMNRAFIRPGGVAQASGPVRSTRTVAWSRPPLPRCAVPRKVCSAGPMEKRLPDPADLCNNPISKGPIEQAGISPIRKSEMSSFGFRGARQTIVTRG
jgi:NADH:ubiquinone oxidoreductase subunit D